MFFACLFFLPMMARAEENDALFPLGLKDSVYMGIYDMNIPVIEITTADSLEPTYEIVDSPFSGTTPKGLTNNNYVQGRMVMRLADSILYNSGDTIGTMKVKVRGNTSAMNLPQKPYKIKLSKKADLVRCIDSTEAGKDKEWLLLVASLKTLVGFKVSEMVGMEWTPDCRMVNVVMNGDYKGFYLLTESVKRAKHRCDIPKEGFIIENDAYWWNEDAYFRTVCNGRTQDLGYTFKYPEIDSMADTFLLNVERYMNEVENVLSNQKDRIDDYIDVTSFAKWELVHDLIGTGDPWGSNMFLYKDGLEEGMLKMGPVWDFDGNYLTKDSWALIHKNTCFYFVDKLNLYDPFIEAYKAEYESVRSKIFDVVSVMQEEYDDLSDDFNRSNAYNNKKNCVDRGDYEEELSIADEWFSSRIAWLDSAINTMESTNALYIDIARVDEGSFRLFLIGADYSQPTTLQVLDASGRTLRYFPDFVWQELNLPPGFYILYARNDNKFATKKLLVGRD